LVLKHWHEVAKTTGAPCLYNRVISRGLDDSRIFHSFQLHRNNRCDDRCNHYGACKGRLFHISPKWWLGILRFHHRCRRIACITWTWQMVDRPCTPFQPILRTFRRSYRNHVRVVSTITLLATSIGKHQVVAFNSCSLRNLPVFSSLQFVF